MKKTNILSLLMFVFVSSLGATAHAQSDPDIVTIGPTEVAMSSGFTLDFDVQLPAADYSGLELKVLFPSGVTFVGGGSPTSGEFSNATQVTGGRAFSQVMPLDLTGGAGVRKFRLVLNLAGSLHNDGTPLTFAVTLTGSSSATTGGPPAPIGTAPVDYTIVARGTSTFAWSSLSGAVANTITSGGGPLLSGEAVPRPGVMRRFVFGARNTGTTLTGGPQNWTVSGGSGYIFIRAFGHGWTRTTVANPNNPSSNFNVTSAHAPWAPLVGPITATYTGTATVPPALYIDVFVPCDDYGRTPEQNTLLAPDYELTASVTNRFVTYDGVVTPVSVEHGPAGAPDLTAVCGQGGSLTKSEEGLTLGGSAARWRLNLSPPFGVAEFEDAMVVDILPGDAISVTPYSTGNNLLTSFTAWVCNFDGILPTQFDVSDFLTERDLHCREGFDAFIPGDTHLVFYTPSWSDPSGVLASARTYLQTNFDPEWSRENEGLRHRNTTYFNGTSALFGGFGDLEEEVGSEDPWEFSVLSPPIPADINGLVLDVSRDVDGDNTATPLIDANGQSRVVYARVRPSGIFPWNPWMQLEIPDGVEVLAADPSPEANCVDFPPPEHRFFPSDLTQNPLEFTFGDGDSPWRLGVEGCRAGVNLTFRLDPDYPFIDGQQVVFFGTAGSDSQVAPNLTDSTSFTAVVTTGMDIALEGDCWTAEVDGVSPPDEGLILFKTTAVNRGSQALDEMELRFVVPAGSSYQTAFPGSDFPLGAILEVSRDGGTTWAPAPTLPDATITDVRIAGFSIEGLGFEAPRPSFYVAVQSNAPTGFVAGQAWAETPTAALGRTAIEEVVVDAEACEPECVCPPSSNPCEVVACDTERTCVATTVDDGTTCAVPTDLCVLAASCQAGVCTPTQRVVCNDQDMCTTDACNPLSGLCTAAEPDCTERAIYMPVTSQGVAVGAIRCDLVPRANGLVLECDTRDGTFVLHPDQGDVCSGTTDPDPDGGGGGGEVPF